MISKQNKKLTLGILLTFIICIGSAIFAAYSTGPYGNYPNPGHHPGEIGPGTFNASGVFIPNWSFPDSTGNRFSGFEIINGEGQFYRGLQIDDYVGAPIDFLVRGDTQLGDDSSDKITVKGDLNVSRGLKIGDSSTTCNSSTEGTVKYNYEEHRLELCNSTDWVSVSGGISHPLNCSCEGTGYKIYNVNGDIVYVDCSTDKCWTPTARLTYTWGGYGTDEPTNSCVGIDSRPACNYCDNLDYGGFTDWLLPDKTTLRDLCSNQGNTPFREGYSTYYWSSTEINSYYAYPITFNDCSLHYTYPKNNALYVRCVRD